MAGSSTRTDNGRAFRMPRWMSTRRTYNQAMIPRPQTAEAAPYYFTYINRVTGDDPLAALENQLEESQGLFSAISEEKSLYHYAADKWSIRQVLNHVTDTERAFTFRALWFARGLESPLPSYDQNVAASGAEADRVSWAAHVEEFQRVRLSTISLFRNMPSSASATGSPGPPTSRSSSACASLPSHFSGTCPPQHRRATASPATIASPCAPSPTSSPDTLPTTSQCCARDTCRDFLPMVRVFRGFRRVGKLGFR